MKRRLSVTPSGSSGDNSGTRLKIGGVSVDVGKPKRPELVPCGYAHENPPQSTLHHLKWLLQKDLLKQDVFLIGVPGSVRRNLVMQYLVITKQRYFTDI
uniref:Uncharacterized protein n=1 Tax=Plectus sambesii TaxID=2011161 RepID=A0A914WYU3_9BILA